MSSTTVALITDIHFGRIAEGGIVDALVSDIQAVGPDLTLVGGDLTQRARKSELRSAAKLIADLNASIVIPGNHDVFAWWFPFRRLTNPLARYRNFISETLDTEYVDDDLAILALNSSFGWTVKSGRFSVQQLSRAKSFFSRTESVGRKLLLVHHHLHPLVDAFGKHDLARRGKDLLDLALEWGVDAILTGHLHQSHAQVVAVGEKSTVLVSSGTATSDRGRRADSGRNIYELVVLEGNGLAVHERLFDRQRKTFVSGRTFRFQRHNRSGWSDSESVAVD